MPDLRRLLADVTPLRESADYRRLWAGQSLSAAGSFMTNVAVAVQVYGLTGSSFAVGAVGLCGLLPTLAFGLLGGSVADAVDRRKLVLFTSCGLMTVAVLLALQAALRLDQVWLLYVLTAIGSGLTAVDMPARRTIVARLLPRHLIPAAGALMQVTFQTTVVAAPLVAGVLLATSGPLAVYLIDVLTFLAVLYGVRRLPPLPPADGGSAPGLKSVLTGIRYARTHRVIGLIFLADLSATVLAMPTALFPALAETRFGGGPATVGILYSAVGVGGFLSAALSGVLGRIRRQGRAMLIAVGLWGLSIACVGFTGQLWLAVGFLAIAGGADIVTTVYRSSIVQTNTPDELRGRLNGLDLVVGLGGPRLGGARAGVLAAVTDPVTAVVLGGAACVLSVLTLATITPDLRRYDATES